MCYFEEVVNHWRDHPNDVAQRLAWRDEFREHPRMADGYVKLMGGQFFYVVNNKRYPSTLTFEDIRTEDWMVFEGSWYDEEYGRPGRPRRYEESYEAGGC